VSESNGYDLERERVKLFTDMCSSYVRSNKANMHSMIDWADHALAAFDKRFTKLK